MTRGKHIWVVLLLIALVVGGVGWWANHLLRQTIQQELRADLQSTLDANVTALEIWMDNQKRIAAEKVEEPRFKALALELLDRAEQGETDRAAIGELTRQLMVGERLQERLRTLGYRMAQLVSTNLTVVADTGRGRSRQGAPVFEDLQARYLELFESGQPILITPFKITPPQGFRGRSNRGGELRGPPPGEGAGGRRGRLNGIRRGPPPRGDLSVMQVAAPVKDAAGLVRGALALIIDPEAQFTRILSVARSGDSGETFAFDSEGIMISESRFDGELKKFKLIKDETNAVSALTLVLRDPGGDLSKGYTLNTNVAQPLIYMVESAIEGGSGVEIEPFRDYRGVPVVGAWRWLPEYAFGVGTKIDAREAYRPLRVVRSVFSILFLLLVLASLVILLFSYLQVIWRRRLTEAELKARQLGQYKILEKIGEGGMGVVYKAHHSLLRRETAIKLLLPEKADPAAIDRFEREVRLTCRLTHPNTIQVYDYGHTPDRIFYYAMEYLDGLNLHELVHHYGSQPEERVLHILRHVCESLSEAHALGLIHRDIKPANVFLCDRGGVPDSVKVLDFGLVKRFAPEPGEPALGETISEAGLVGTPNFIAPEVIVNPDKADARSDLYAVGVLGYYLLTGQEIFQGETMSELCKKHLTEKPVPPGSRAGKKFDPQFESLLMRCLEKAPAARPQSASELARMFAECAPANQWTLEQRSIWWTQHRSRAAAMQIPVPPSPAQIEKTVKIEFAERTP